MSCGWTLKNSMGALTCTVYVFICVYFIYIYIIYIHRGRESTYTSTVSNPTDSLPVANTAHRYTNLQLGHNVSRHKHMCAAKQSRPKDTWDQGSGNTCHIFCETKHDIYLKLDVFHPQKCHPSSSPAYKHARSNKLSAILLYIRIRHR